MVQKTSKSNLIVYSYYVLDLIHKGHFLYMKNAKALVGSDGTSIVGILTDKAVMEKKKKPLFSFEERIEFARAIRYVDCVVAQETYSPLTNLERIKPDIAIESAGHDPKEIANVRTLMDSIGGRVIVFPYYPTYSSSRIKQWIRENGRSK